MPHDPVRRRIEAAKLAKRLPPLVFDRGWLGPEDFHPEVLGPFRGEHGRLLEQLASVKAAEAELTAEYDAEDREFEQATLAAARECTEAPEDTRTPAAEREAALAPHGTRRNAALVALAELVDRAVAAFREHEDEWLAELRGPARKAARLKEQEARRLLIEARNEHYRVFLWGRWVQTRANDDQGGQQQPPPVHAVAPPNWSEANHRDMLERHWSRLRPWNAGYAAVQEQERVITHREAAVALEDLAEGRLAEEDAAAEPELFSAQNQPEKVA
jgi:hypothetical protein